MTILEKKSRNKKIALMDLARNGYYPVSYAMLKADEYNDEGKLLDADYLELIEYLESLLNPVVEETPVEEAAEDTQDTENAETEETTVEEDTENSETEVTE